MQKGKDEHAFYLKETMRLMPIGFERGRRIHIMEKEFRAADDYVRAEQYRAVKMEVYDFTFDCRLRNQTLINSARLRHCEWKLLRMRFLRGYTWERLFNTQGYSVDHCKRLHRDGVSKIAQSNRETDYKVLYEQERKRLENILAQIDEKI